MWQGATGVDHEHQHHQRQLHHQFEELGRMAQDAITLLYAVPRRRAGRHRAAETAVLEDAAQPADGHQQTHAAGEGIAGIVIDPRQAFEHHDGEESTEQSTDDGFRPQERDRAKGHQAVGLRLRQRLHRTTNRTTGKQSRHCGAEHATQGGDQQQVDADER